MSRLLLTAAVLAVLVYSMVLGVRWLSPRIEQDIAERVTTGLAEQGLLWADVNVEGRDVVLSGVAPDEDAKTRAVSVVSRVFGVSKVTDEMVISGSVSDTVAGVSGTEVKKVVAKVKAKKPAEDYALTINKDGDKISLEGNVPDESSKAVLIKLAETHYGAGNVDYSKLTVLEGAPAGWRSAVGAVLMHIANMEEARAVISGTEVMVSGSVLDKQYSDKMEQDVSQVLPKDYKAAFAVEVVSPTVADVEPAAGDEAVVASGDCVKTVDLTKQTLMFGFDKADLTDGHKAKIKTVATEMVSCVDEKVVLAGYTDVTGSKLYNKWLSQQRAEATMRGLMREGVNKDRLKAVGYGEKFPVAANTSKSGRAQNRRVEFVVGDVLPHGGEAVVAKEPVKATKPVVKEAPKAKKVKAEVKEESSIKATVIEVVSDTAAVASKTTAVVVSETKAAAKKTKAVVVSATETAVSETKAIAKPWWARKTVSDSAIEIK